VNGGGHHRGRKQKNLVLWKKSPHLADDPTLRGVCLPPGPAAPKVSAKIVLLVDSHEDSRTIYTAILEHHGFAVLAASRGDDGLRLSRERRPDLIVVEFAPPRQASLALVRAFRSDTSLAAVPVVALSTTLGDTDRDLLLAEGIAAYMAKPCPPLTLLAEARRLLGA